MKGVYILLIDISKDIKVKIGSLGRIKFNKGKYFYIGSAQKSLEKRIARHKSKNKNKFWHIDYLLSSKHSKILSVFYKKADKSEECNIAKKLTNVISDTEDIIPRFGSSDCKCKSHLLKINNPENIYNLRVKNL